MTSSSVAGLQSLNQFVVRQRIAMVVNRYEIRPSRDGEVLALALAQQKRMPLKEQVTFFADEQRTGRITGAERNVLVAILRRFNDIDFLPYHFDFSLDGGQPAMSVERAWTVRDTYTVTVHDPGPDRRLAAAMAVALDALQNR